jgi:Skp family chaperone for outer membrane proteins
MQTKTFWAVGLIAAVVLSVYLTAQAQSGSAAATKVAVVNLQTVIDNSAMQKSVQDKNRAEAQNIRAEEEKRRAEIQKLNAELDPLAPGGGPWLAKRDEIQQKAIELRVWVEMTEQTANRERARQFAEVYKAATDAVSKVADASGFDIVLQGGELPDLMQLNPQQLQLVAQNRKVLYSRDASDITQAVQARMDAEFKNP